MTFLVGASGAVISDDQRYRYALWRTPGHYDRNATVAFLMLNPSTADALQDDPTIRRCCGFARDWGFRRLIVGNVFAFRATDPAELATAVEPAGPDNRQWLHRIAMSATLVVAAWGAHPHVSSVQTYLRDVLRDVPLQHLGLTKAGHPKHPLYLRRDIRPQPYFFPEPTVEQQKAPDTP